MELAGTATPALAGTAVAAARVLTGSCPDSSARSACRSRRSPPFSGTLARPGGAGAASRRKRAGQAAAGTGRGRHGRHPREARARLFVEMLSLLERLARQRPVVLVIEDAHWADESSRELLSFLVASQQAMDRVLIIVTYRSDELHRGHPLCSLISSLARLGWVQRRNLSGLSRDESAELVARLAGGPPVPSLAEKVWRRAEGSPLLAEQLVCCDSPPARACPAAGDLMLSAVRQLPAQTQEVLRAASAGGQRTGLGLLAAVTGMDADALDAALRPAATRGVITAGQGSCTFRHALISEAVHTDLLPGEHTDLHHRFADGAAGGAVAGAGRARGDGAGRALASRSRPGQGAEQRLAGGGRRLPRAGICRAACHADQGARAVAVRPRRRAADRDRSRAGAPASGRGSRRRRRPPARRRHWPRPYGRVPARGRRRTRCGPRRSPARPGRGDRRRWRSQGAGSSARTWRPPAGRRRAGGRRRARPRRSAAPRTPPRGTSRRR